MKNFSIPAYYRSSITGRIKSWRKEHDPRKQDLSPTLLNFGPIQFFIARHFGFCYGVENAIEISYRALEDNAGKRVFLLSQMIHNQDVNNDLQERGIQFIMDTDGTQFVKWDEIIRDDIVIIPAFGTTLEIENLLKKKGVDVQKYNTTCPFVEKVWNRAEKLGTTGYTVIIHGKPNHEETRATFSHSAGNSPSVIIRDIEEAHNLGSYISNDRNEIDFYREFEGRYTKGFSPHKDLLRVGVVNQTTMLASETQQIAEYFKTLMGDLFGPQNINDHFADTRDTLCYATNDNQQATYQLLETEADVALVVGGYNSSNTSHIVELCERKFPTYFINSEDAIRSREELYHFNYRTKEFKTTHNFLPQKAVVKVVLTSGASCPDTLVDGVMEKLVGFFDDARPLDDVLEPFGSGS